MLSKHTSLQPEASHDEILLPTQTRPFQQPRYSSLTTFIMISTSMMQRLAQKATQQRNYDKSAMDTANHFDLHLYSHAPTQASRQKYIPASAPRAWLSSYGSSSTHPQGQAVTSREHATATPRDQGELARIEASTDASKPSGSIKAPSKISSSAKRQHDFNHTDESLKHKDKKMRASSTTVLEC